METDDPSSRHAHIQAWMELLYTEGATLLVGLTKKNVSILLV